MDSGNLLTETRNPSNMGICVACFERDIADAIRFHRAAVVQYMRPEIIEFVLGSLMAAYLFKELDVIRRILEHLLFFLFFIFIPTS